MKNLFKIALLCASVALWFNSAFASNVIFNMQQIVGYPSNPQITISLPDDAAFLVGTNIVYGFATIQCTNGTATVSNLAPLVYDLDIQGINRRFRMPVPNDTNTYSAFNLITVGLQLESQGQFFASGSNVTLTTNYTLGLATITVNAVLTNYISSTNGFGSDTTISNANLVGVTSIDDGAITTDGSGDISTSGSITDGSENVTGTVQAGSVNANNTLSGGILIVSGAIQSDHNKIASDSFGDLRSISFATGNLTNTNTITTGNLTVTGNASIPGVQPTNSTLTYLGLYPTNSVAYTIQLNALSNALPAANLVGLIPSNNLAGALPQLEFSNGAPLTNVTAFQLQQSAASTTVLVLTNIGGTTAILWPTTLTQQGASGANYAIAIVAPSYAGSTGGGLFFPSFGTNGGLGGTTWSILANGQTNYLYDLLAGQIGTCPMNGPNIGGGTFGIFTDPGVATAFGYFYFGKENHWVYLDPTNAFVKFPNLNATGGQQDARTNSEWDTLMIDEHHGTVIASNTLVAGTNLIVGNNTGSTPVVVKVNNFQWNSPLTGDSQLINAAAFDQNTGGMLTNLQIAPSNSLHGGTLGTLLSLGFMAFDYSNYNLTIKDGYTGAYAVTVSSVGNSPVGGTAVLIHSGYNFGGRSDGIFNIGSRGGTGVGRPGEVDVTSNLYVGGGIIYQAGAFTTNTIVQSGLTNGGTWVGMLSNKLVAVYMTNNTLEISNLVNWQ